MDLEGRLDSVDWALLTELQHNARLTYSELGRRIGLTPPAVIERIRKMEEAEVITGYRLELNLEKIGRPFNAILRIASYDTRSCNALSGIIQQSPEVLECDRVTGDDCYVMKVALTSPQHLESFVNRLVAYGKTTTSVVLSSTVTRRVIEPPQGAEATPQERAEQMSA